MKHHGHTVSETRSMVTRRVDEDDMLRWMRELGFDCRRTKAAVVARCMLMANVVSSLYLS